MNLTDYRYPEEQEPENRRTGEPSGRRRTQAAQTTRPIGAIIAAGFAGVLIIAMVAMITYQLAHPPRPMGIYTTTTSTMRPTEPPTDAIAEALRTGVLHTPTPDPRYDHQLPAGTLGGFGTQPRDLDVGERRFTLLSCEAWDCQVELDDGTRVWVAVDQAGEPTPAPAPAPPVRLPVMICADASGLNGQSHVCAPDGDYNALLAQAQNEAGPPIGQPQPTSAGADAFSTQSALGDQTAYAVQTEQAHIVETQTQPTPVAAQQVR